MWGCLNTQIVLVLEIMNGNKSGTACFAAHIASRNSILDFSQIRGPLIEIFQLSLQTIFDIDCVSRIGYLAFFQFVVPTRDHAILFRGDSLDP